ncbi:MAG: hypothetical protein HY318_19135 [Armatimonadetes bacterium]|nr:hypothetical protein [Armatimonadota bacterium]
MTKTLRARFESALAGEPTPRPVYAVYDWFVQNRDIDWQSLFDLGLGQISHATVVEHQRPHVQVVETIGEDPSGMTRRDVRWITDIGELHEAYLGEWRQEFLIKKPQDYRIMARALSDAEIKPVPQAFHECEDRMGETGITLGCTELRRTAFQVLQIDYAGLERFSIDLATGVQELLELIELMNDLTFREFEAVAQTPARHLKLWENLSIETMGPVLYRKHLVPVYQRIFDLLQRSGQKLHVHYDGNLRVIADQIRELPFDGLDSLTEPPEGDMTTAEARQCWPDKFLWLHPNLGWYQLPDEHLTHSIKRMCREAGSSRHCLMISEEVPPDWERAVPAVLRALGSVESDP